LASGGADSKVIIWDINEAKPMRNMTEHKDKVQVVKWNKKEDNILLTSSYDKTVKLHDLRMEKSCVTFNIPSEIECIDWNPLNQSQFLSMNYFTFINKKPFAFNKLNPSTQLNINLII
jgi:periodic tryptophan protein 1